MSAVSHDSGCNTGRPSTAPSSCGSPGNATFQSPRKTGVLAASYESRFGAKNCLAQDLSGIEAIVTPRPSRRQIDNESMISDPRNPFNRTPSKFMTHVEEVRADYNRAGRRTYNPSMICQERRDSAKTATFGYSTTVDWRPGKIFTGAMRGTGNPTHLDESSGGGVNQNHNYLNDMKKTTTSRHAPTSPPSKALQRMKDRESVLPAAMEGAHERKEPVPTPTTRIESKRITQDFGKDSQDMLYHKGDKLPAKRFERLEKAADKHFGTIVDHMKQTTREQRMYGELFRARAQSSLGLFGE